MNNLNKFNSLELSKHESEELSGGFIAQLIIAATAVGVASYMAGYTVGKDLYHLMND
ncbi:hypothetical protein [Galbibacter sp. BG1]|uniref:hypothetical protein n=1 Tax=Galbibacter sp. BG1 TaxID=1170699 RepID=UPI00293B8948|nr:hypothetical protein [Galbibacter sp. BG1]